MNIFHAIIILNIVFGVYIWWDNKRDKKQLKRETKLLKENHIDHALKELRNDFVKLEGALNKEFTEQKNELIRQMDASWERIDEYVKITNAQENKITAISTKIDFMQDTFSKVFSKILNGKRNR